MALLVDWKLGAYDRRDWTGSHPRHGAQQPALGWPEGGPVPHASAAVGVENGISQDLLKQAAPYRGSEPAAQSGPVVPQRARRQEPPAAEGLAPEVQHSVRMTARMRYS